MKYLQLLILLSAQTIWAGQYSEVAQNAAEDFLGILEKKGDIQSIDNYEIRHSRFYSSQTNAYLAKPSFTRIGIPKKLWASLNRDDRVDLLHVLKLYTRPEQDKFPNGELVHKYIKAGKDNRYLIIFIPPSFVAAESEEHGSYRNVSSKGHYGNEAH